MRTGSHESGVTDPYSLRSASARLSTARATTSLPAISSSDCREFRTVRPDRQASPTVTRIISPNWFSKRLPERAGGYHKRGRRVRPSKRARGLVMLQHSPFSLFKRASLAAQSFAFAGILAAACGTHDPLEGIPPTSSNGAPLRACASDGDCAQPDPYCLPGGGYCVQCMSTNNCGGRQCSPTTHQCVQCTTNAECGGPTPYCSATNQCVECVGTGNCPMGLVCNTTTNRCAPGCTNDANCNPLAPYCSPGLGVCVGCLGDSNCRAGSPYCNTQSGACVECLTDANCANGNGGGNTCRGFRCR